jgi:hypothetical protein
MTGIVWDVSQSDWSAAPPEQRFITESGKLGIGPAPHSELNDYDILMVNNGLMISQKMTREEAKAYIASHPEFEYRDAAL